MVSKVIARSFKHVCFVAIWLGIVSFCMPGRPCFGASNDFEKGLVAARSGQIDLAIKLWTKMISRHPKSYAAHVNRGQAYIYAGKVLNGVTDWHKAKELAPAFAYGLYTGDFILEDSENSLLSFAAPLELDPAYLPSVFMTAATYLDVGRTDKAVELYRKSIDLTTNPLLKSYLDHWASSIESSRTE